MPSKCSTGVIIVVYSILSPTLYGESGNQAEELLQDVFLKVVKASKRYEPSAKFTTWLYQIARNGCIDHFRKMKHRKTTSLAQPIDNEEEMVLESTIAANKSFSRESRADQ